MRIIAPNTTDLPNDLVDHWLPLLKEGELKVLLVIIRKTFGWHKQRDRISLSQLEKITGLCRRNIIDSIKSLIGKGLVMKETTGTFGAEETYYWLVIDDDDQCKIYTPPSVNNTPPPVYNLHPQKKLVKETSKSISKDIERERAHEEPLNKIGSFVALTTSDLEKLESEHGKAKIAEYIQAVNDYCASKGKRYKDYAATIRNWIRRDKEKAQIRGYSNKVDRRTKNLDGSPVETPYDNLF